MVRPRLAGVSSFPNVNTVFAFGFVSRGEIRLGFPSFFIRALFRDVNGQ
jgi:hypothetical protein